MDYFEESTFVAMRLNKRIPKDRDTLPKNDTEFMITDHIFTDNQQ